MDNLGGRPRTLTGEKQDELINRIGQGATVAEAAGIVGVSLRTVQREAKDNEQFGHDLQLALGSAPSDPYQLMLRAARTHWRAAAWLLERSDPERFGKRPPNSCRPEQMRNLATVLIEAALQFVSPERRELLDCHLQAVADQALEAVLPAQRKRELTTYRPLPDEGPDATTLDGILEQAAAREEAAQRAAVWNGDEVLSPKRSAATKLSAAVAPRASEAQGEVLSPEMHDASEPVTAPNATKGLPKAARAVDRKAFHVMERAQARRARRQAARAKRKARKAA